MSDTALKPRIPKVALTFLLVLGGIAVPYFVPFLGRYRMLRPGELSRAWAVEGRVKLLEWREKAVEAGKPSPRSPVRPAQPGPAPEGAPVPVPGGVVKRRASEASLESFQEDGEPEIEDETGTLNPFFARLLRTERKEAGAVTRISHFGDSPLTGDLISGEARARLQKAYGDAGHGFILAGRPWGWYGHDGVTLKASHWKALSPLLTPGDGGIHGLGGVSFSGSPASRTEIILDRGSYSRCDVTFLARPGGGRFFVSAGKDPPLEVQTDGLSRAGGVFSLRLKREESSLTLLAKGDGPVSLHGVVLEREGPGIVYDALGANGAAVHMLTLLDAEGWIQAIGARKPDLVILSYGTNESGYVGIPGTRYRLDWIEVIGRIRRALPGVSILVMAPMDRGMRREDGAIVTLPSIPKIVEAQRGIARELGCAFFDTFSAMGGEGTMARWYSREPRLVSGDFTHTTKGGSDRVARLLVAALDQAYTEWKDVAGAEPAP